MRTPSVFSELAGKGRPWFFLVNLARTGLVRSGPGEARKSRARPVSSPVQLCVLASRREGERARQASSRSLAGGDCDVPTFRPSPAQDFPRPYSPPRLPASSHSPLHQGAQGCRFDRAEAII